MIQDVPLVSRVKVPVTTNTKNSDSFYVKNRDYISCVLCRLEKAIFQVEQ